MLMSKGLLDSDLRRTDGVEAFEIAFGDVAHILNKAGTWTIDPPASKVQRS